MSSGPPKAPARRRMSKVNSQSAPLYSGSIGPKIGENINFLRDRVADIDTLAAKTRTVVVSTERLGDISRQLIAGTHISRESAERLQTLSEEARDHLADYDDFFRPIRNYFHWEPHCYDIPICWAFRSLIETVDSVDMITDEFRNTVHGLQIIDTVTPQVLDQIQAIATSLNTVQALTLTLQSTLHSLVDQLDVFIKPLVDMAQAFDNAKNDDFFFLPPQSQRGRGTGGPG